MAAIVVSNHKEMLTLVPERQLLENSVHIGKNKKLKDWTTEDYANSYEAMQKIVYIWKKNEASSQYLIYGSINSKIESNLNAFYWQLVPFQKCSHVISRAVQQIQVLWRTIFGGLKLNDTLAAKQAVKTQNALGDIGHMIEPMDASNKGYDAFCNEEVISKQWIKTGEKVNVLLSHAPIGGKDKMHFLIVPKEHRETFSEVTKEEYCESIKLTSDLVHYITKTRKDITNVYLLNKNGIDAGQTIKQWHLHVIFTTNTIQDFFGKLMVFKNILFGSSAMKSNELASRVKLLRDELSSINYTKIE